MEHVDQVDEEQLAMMNERTVNEDHFDNCYNPFQDLYLYRRKQAMDDLVNTNMEYRSSVERNLRLKRMAEKTMPNAKPDAKIQQR